MLFEACVGNIKEAIEAEKRGANRIELCDNLMEGGTTPSVGTIEAAMKYLSVPFNVIIRPRGGDFVFNEVEVEIMKRDIAECKRIGVNGLVVGVTTKDRKIDVNILKELIEDRDGLEVTYHMAFDELINPFEAIDILIELGVDRILTKGGEGSAPQNKDRIKEYIEYAKGRIIILPGGGVNKENKESFGKYVDAIELHGTKIV